MGRTEELIELLRDWRGVTIKYPEIRDELGMSQPSLYRLMDRAATRDALVEAGWEVVRGNPSSLKRKGGRSVSF